MRNPLRVTAVTVATGAVLLVGAPAAVAQEVRDPYTGVLPTTLTRTNGSPTGVLSGTANRPSTLPFTGGELVLLATAGASAVGGGVALAVAGRRRKAA